VSGDPFDQAVPALADLFLSLFKQGELERFLRYNDMGEILSVVSFGRASNAVVAMEVAEALRRHKRIDATLFDLLLEERPGHERNIRDVQAISLSTSTPAIRHDRTIPTNASRRAVRERLDADRRARRSASDPSRPWIEAVAVLGPFDPLHLVPAAPSDAGPLMALAPHVVERPDGTWILKETVRRWVLPAILDAGRLGALQALNPSQHTRVSRYLRGALEYVTPPLADLSTDELADLAEAISWLDGRGAAFWIGPQIAAFLERRRTIGPLRRLVGTHFRGRSPELERLRSHVASAGDPEVLVLWGAGGVGKSTLLGSLLLEEEATQMPRPFAYVDFDHAQHDPRSPTGIVQTVARQLGMLYALDRSLSIGFTGLESAAAADDLSFALPAGDLSALCAELGRRLAQIPLDGAPFLLVFDTFERVQAMGAAAIQSVASVVTAVRQWWPRTRVIVSGRAPVPEWLGATHLHLGALDPAYADLVLAALGVKDAALAIRLVRELGTNPLTLRLAAEVVVRLGVDGLTDAGSSGRVIDEARDALVQQQLYSRILWHLKDHGVGAFAHPGLVVRRVTPAIIAQVLAEPCGLDPAHADSLFARLGEELTLMEPAQDGALRHRADVRETMLRAMVFDGGSAAQRGRIHELAERFYAGGPTIVERAELLYHRLWLERPADTLEASWAEDLKLLLGPALSEPLPERSRVWLAARVGSDQPPFVDTATWEARAEGQARIHLDAGNAGDALLVLRERTDRSPGGAIPSLEAEALLALGRAPEATAVIDAARPAATGRAGLALDLVAMAIAETRPDLSDPAAATQRALATARLIGDGFAEMKILLSSKPPDAERLSRLFLAADAESLRVEDALAARVIRATGGGSLDVLRRAIELERGDRRSPFRTDVFGLREILTMARDRPGGPERLAALAGRIGLSERSFDVFDLASAAVRYGRLGDAIRAALDVAGDDPSVRERIAMFAREPKRR
jgi:hypothetical protein